MIVVSVYLGSPVERNTKLLAEMTVYDLPSVDDYLRIGDKLYRVMAKVFLEASKKGPVADIYVAAI